MRDPPEWSEDGYIERFHRIFFAEMADKTQGLPKDKQIAVICSAGNRSSMASSVLERAGYRNITNVLGGMTAWTNLAYPTKKDD